MNCDKYRIMDRGNIIAGNMSLEIALILLKALFQEYWNDTLVRYTIEKEPMAMCEGDEDEQRRSS